MAAHRCVRNVTRSRDRTIIPLMRQGPVPVRSAQCPVPAARCAPRPDLTASTRQPAHHPQSPAAAWASVLRLQLVGSSEARPCPPHLEDDRRRTSRETAASSMRDRRVWLASANPLQRARMALALGRIGPHTFVDANGNGERDPGSIRRASICWRGSSRTRPRGPRDGGVRPRRDRRRGRRRGAAPLRARTDRPSRPRRSKASRKWRRR